MTEAKRFEDFGIVRKICDTDIGVRDVQWPHHVENEILFDPEIIVGQSNSTVQQENHISFNFTGWNDRFNQIQQNIDTQIPYHRNLLPATTKLGQGNIFTSVCQEFCPRGWRCLPQCMLGYTTPPGSRPPGADTPQSRHPPEQTPRTRQTPPLLWKQTPPPREADCTIRSTTGRYASYRNAFLFQMQRFLFTVLIFITFFPVSVTKLSNCLDVLFCDGPTSSFCATPLR